MTSPETVLSFWLDEIGEKCWYAGDEALDAKVRLKFKPAWDEMMAGGMSMWLTYPSGALAYIILADQFSRNMFRDTAQAFASDRMALAAAKAALNKGWDMKIDEPARQFFYLPLIHSENLCDQERAVRLIMTRMPETGADNLLHARAHRDVIRRFGRFPFRNAALDRAYLVHEEAFEAEGGYGAAVRAISG